MREIKFRGLDRYGKWHYGTYRRSWMYDENKIPQATHYIVDSYGNEILVEHAGQFTGLKDKNQVPIYEGDIVGRLVYRETKRENEDGSVSYLTHINKEKVWTHGVISYSEKEAGFKTGNSKIWLGHYDDIKILGNTYEHSHLLEGDSHD